MDPASLVTEDIENGSNVIEALREAELPFEIAGWVHDAELDAWRLIIATPLVDEVGSLDTYRRISAVAREAGLQSSFLSRVTVTGVDDPVAAHLRVVKEAAEKAGPDFPVLTGIDFSPTERFYLYDESGIAYEKALLAAFQRVTPARAVIRRAERAFYEDPGFDFVIDDGMHRFFVEAKFSTRPISRAQLRFFMTNFRARPPVLVVSNVDLMTSTAEWLAEQPDLFFVRWHSIEDDGALKSSVESLLTGPPSYGAVSGP